MFAASIRFSQPVITPERGGVVSTTTRCYYTQVYFRIRYFMEHAATCGRSFTKLIPTRVKADSFRGFQTGASQTLWRRTGGSPCGQGLHFVRTMMQPSFGP